jgi:hypothetical protein
VKSIQRTVARFKPEASAEISASQANKRACDKLLARRDCTSLIEFLAIRYLVALRIVGELSFRVVARRFVLSVPASCPDPS